MSCVRPARSFRRPALTRIVRCSVGKQIVNVPSFMVRTDSQKHIDFALNSPFGGGRAGRVKRRNQKVRVLHLRTFAPSVSHLCTFRIRLRRERGADAARLPRLAERLKEGGGGRRR